MDIRFNKIDGFIRSFDGTRNEKCEAVYDGIRYLISLKSGITYIFSQYFAKFKIDSFDSLLTEKKLTLHNFILLIKSALGIEENTTIIRYFYNNVFTS